MYRTRHYEDVANFLKIKLEKAKEPGEVKSYDAEFNENKPEEYYIKATPLGYLNKKNINFHVVKDTTTLTYSLAAGLKSMMEIGCGSSLTALTLARNGIHVVAYDFPSDTLTFQNWRKNKYHINNLYYRNINVFNRDRSKYDGIVCFEVLEHIKDPRPMMDKLDSHLNLGGYLFLSISSQAKLPTHDPEHICEMTNIEVVKYLINKGYSLIQGIKLSEEQSFNHQNYPIILIKGGEQPV